MGSFVFSHYLIMGEFFCITEKFLFCITGSMFQNVPPTGYLHQPIAEAVSDDQDTIFPYPVFSPPPAMPPMVLSSVKTVPSFIAHLVNTSSGIKIHASVRTLQFFKFVFSSSCDHSFIIIKI